MRLVRRIDFPAGEDEDAEGHLVALVRVAVDGRRRRLEGEQAPGAVAGPHQRRDGNTTDDRRQVAPGELAAVFELAAQWHDLGKQRKLFQTVLGNSQYPDGAAREVGQEGRAASRRRTATSSVRSRAVEPDEFKATLARTEGLGAAPDRGAPRPRPAALPGGRGVRPGRTVEAARRGRPRGAAAVRAAAAEVRSVGAGVPGVAVAGGGLRRERGTRQGS